MRSAISARSRAWFDRLTTSGVGLPTSGCGLEARKTGSRATPFVLSLAKDRSQPYRRIHRAHRIVRPALPARQELVHDAPFAEQPSSADLPQLVLVDPKGAHLEALAGAVVGHLEPLGPGPRTVLLYPDRSMSEHVAQHGRVAVFVLVVLADADFEAFYRFEDRGLSFDPAACEFEFGIVGEHLDEA